ncbi:ATP-dependent Clp protease proteolytic subunit, partial [Shigella flexneri]|nr:ATP-dependent Clp protease proteolytic subunit [Shigella flexneri]
RMNELIALHGGQSLEQIERDTERERFLSAPEAERKRSRSVSRSIIRTD